MTPRRYTWTAPCCLPWTCRSGFVWALVLFYIRERGLTLFGKPACHTVCLRFTAKDLAQQLRTYHVCTCYYFLPVGISCLCECTPVLCDWQTTADIRASRLQALLQCSEVLAATHSRAVTCNMPHVIEGITAFHIADTDSSKLIWPMWEVAVHMSLVTGKRDRCAQVLDPSIKVTMPPAPTEDEEDLPKPKQTPGTLAASSISTQCCNQLQQACTAWHHEHRWLQVLL